MSELTCEPTGPLRPLELSVDMPDEAIASEFREDFLGNRLNYVRTMADTLLVASDLQVDKPDVIRRQAPRPDALMVVGRLIGRKFGEPRPSGLTQGLLEEYVASTMYLAPLGSELEDFPFVNRGAQMLLRARGYRNADIQWIAAVDAPKGVTIAQMSILHALHREHFKPDRLENILRRYLALGGVALPEELESSKPLRGPAKASKKAGPKVAKDQRKWSQVPTTDESLEQSEIKDQLQAKLSPSDLAAAESFERVIKRIKPQLSIERVMNKRLFDHLVLHFCGIKHPELVYRDADLSRGLATLRKDVQPLLDRWAVFIPGMTGRQAGLLNRLFGISSSNNANVRPESFAVILQNLQQGGANVTDEQLRAEIHRGLRKLAGS